MSRKFEVNEFQKYYHQNGLHQNYIEGHPLGCCSSCSSWPCDLAFPSFSWTCLEKRSKNERHLLSTERFKSQRILVGKVQIS